MIAFIREIKYVINIKQLTSVLVYNDGVKWVRLLLLVH